MFFFPCVERHLYRVYRSEYWYKGSVRLVGNNGAIEERLWQMLWSLFCYAEGNGFNMNKLEYFGKVIKVVTELMDVTDQEILGKSRESDVVDARWMVICLMKEKGYTTKQIAPLMLRPIRTINHAVNSFSDRAKYSFNGLGNTLAIARQLLQE